MAGYVLVAEIDLHVPAAGSLKERRRALRPIVDRARDRLRLSIAEVGDVEHWQTAQLCAAVAASSVTAASETVDELERLVWSRPDVDVVAFRRTWTELEDDT